ncbi:hypothetical protein [Agrobacterium tumefaciens]|uniref:hypothetical protein n=1 Tax=Agrobacterium tumefaciens TaxID=358 RepID=UPI001571B5F3|nr:hypothetical protein [Agrobacterium tumefaciens]NSX94442.1 hypothetical protein [Agrobacterium tumefaciens]
METGENIAALNYSAHAIEDMKEMVRRFPAHFVQSAAAIRVVGEMLRRSVKFILPNCAELLDPLHFSQAHIDLLKLPFPLVAFEMPWQKTDATDAGFLDHYTSSRRIALCWEAEATPPELTHLNEILVRFPQGGVFVLPIAWLDPLNIWNVGIGGAFVPYENSLNDIDPTKVTPLSARAMKALDGAGLLPRKPKQFAAEPFILQMEHFEAIAAKNNREIAFSNIMNDTRDEGLALLQACAVLNCENVATKDIEAPAKLNKARIAKGKQPFFSYKILALTADRVVAGGAGDGTGTHASPRLHLRRGHLRRLPDKTIWVRATMIGASSGTGVVSKEYRLTRSSRNET